LANVGKLSNADRDLFQSVADAVKANPFGSERVALDRLMAEGEDHQDRDTVLFAALNRVASRLEALRQAGLRDLKSCNPATRELLEAAILFVTFHRKLQDVDRFVVETIEGARGERRAAFAVELLAHLEGWGIDRDEAVRYVARFYQIRRAYHFIYYAAFGCSPSMQAFRRALWNNIFTCDIRLYDRYLWNRMEDFSTLLLGETGTGKGTAAMAIGRSGFIPFSEQKKTFVESFTRSFVSLNLSQFPDTLIESELFGHKKGAFTGAVKDHRGVFDRCSPYGAILLDEIGELSIPIQIKLLQVLQDRKYSAVGSHIEGRFQGRVIAATNRSMSDIENQKVFRDDFYYRLCSDIITVPPLRERIRESPKELDDLLKFTVKRMVGQSSSELLMMVRGVIDSQLGDSYPWPGNVRELEQCVRRVLLKKDYAGRAAVSAGDRLSDILARDLSEGKIDTQRLVTGYCYMLHQRFGTYEAVARRTGLDRRTVKKYINGWDARTT